MKKRLASLLMCLCLAVGLLPTIAHGNYTLTRFNFKDNIRWSGIYDVETEKSVKFDYEVPQDGAAVLIFFRTSCGNCQNTFSLLNEEEWVHNDRLNFYAIEGSEYTFSDIRTFRQERCPKLTDSFTWLDTTHAGIAFDYSERAGLDSWAWPLVVICTEEKGVKTVRYLGSQVMDVNRIGNSLEELLGVDWNVPTPVPLTIQVEADYDLAAEMVALVNEKRAENNFPALNFNKALTEVAMLRAAEMVLYANDTDRPNGSKHWEMVQEVMPDVESIHYVSSAYAHTPADFLEGIALYDFDNWYIFEYDDGPSEVGIGCVIVNGRRHWSIITTTESAVNAPTTQIGQVDKTYTIDCYPHYLSSPGLSPDEPIIYLSESESLTLYGNAASGRTPLVPVSCDSEIKDENGQVIATAKMQANGTILISTTAIGTGKLNVWAWEGQKTPYTTKITVSDDPKYRLNRLHTAVEGSGCIELSQEQARYDSWIDLTAVAEEGWWLASLYVQDAEGNTPECYMLEENEYTFCMPASDVTVTAQFLPNSVPQTKFGIHEELWDNGTPNSIHSRFDSAYANTTVVLQYTPEDGYVLTEVTATDATGQALDVTKLRDFSYSFTMPLCDVNVRAIFAPAAGYPIITESPYGNGTATADPPAAMPYDKVTVTLSPDEGYETDSIRINLSEDQYTWIDENTLTFTMPAYEVEIRAYFKKLPTTSGTFGEGLQWKFADGTLTISGKGSMSNSEDAWSIPWYECEDQIETLVLEEGVTEILSNSFGNLDALTAVSIPSTIEYIGEWAFSDNTALREITFAGSAPSRGIESSAFSGVTATVYVPANDRSWTSAVTQDYGGTLMWTHSWSSEVIAPTCIEDGYTRYTCICGDTAKDDFTDAWGHQYTDGVCDRCGDRDPNHKKPIPNPFIDVNESDWFCNSVLWAVENQVTGGISATEFGPNQNCTRAQVVTFLYAAAGKPAVHAGSEPFTDVSESDWFYTPVLWAVENGITGGTSASTFSPNDECTRTQVVTFLYAAAGKPDISASSDFIDVADTDWYAKPVIWAKSNDITGGIGDGLFGPLVTCTRAQVVTFLYKASLVQ